MCWRRLTGPRRFRMWTAPLPSHHHHHNASTTPARSTPKSGDHLRRTLLGICQAWGARQRHIKLDERFSKSRRTAVWPPGHHDNSGADQERSEDLRLKTTFGIWGRLVDGGLSHAGQKPVPSQLLRSSSVLLFPLARRAVAKFMINACAMYHLTNSLS